MDVDFLYEPPFFRVSDTHFAATWLLHEYAPAHEPPQLLKQRALAWEQARAKKGDD